MGAALWVLLLASVGVCMGVCITEFGALLGEPGQQEQQRAR